MSILLSETGFTPIKHIINEKRILQAHRIKGKTGKSLIKENTNPNNSIWMKKTIQIMKEYNIPEEALLMKKYALKKEIKKAMGTKIEEEIMIEANEKTKVNHWKQLIGNVNDRKRPPYMEKLNRKQCQAILGVRTSMFPARMNFKNGYEDRKCRYCESAEETQEHIIEKCQKIPRTSPILNYREIFEDQQVNDLKTIAETLKQLSTTIQEKTTNPE